MKYFFLFIAVIILFNCKPEKEEPKPLTAPVLTTMEAGDITAISALSGGAISSDGGSPVTARGIVWGVSHNPTLADSVSEEGTGIGSFTSDLTPLKYSTTYYVRAYATNSIGTTYGNEVTFNTKAAVPSDGLVGWWPFNGNANDESGNGNDGVVNGATLTNDRLGNLENAYNFNGVDSYIDLYSTNQILNAINGLQKFSLSFWVYVADNSIGSIWGHWSNNNGGVGVNCGFVSGFNPISGTGFYSSNNSGCCGFIQPSYNNYNSWSNVIIVYDALQADNAEVIKMYVDNTVIEFSPGGIANTPIGTGTSLFLGRRNTDFNTYGDYFLGDIDDVAVYSRTLTAEEIQKIYNGAGF